MLSNNELGNFDTFSDLENAMNEPEKYGSLIVRVGGFSARFIDLPKDVQMEILSRTLY